MNIGAMKLHVRITLADNRGGEFVGAGLLKLLDGIERHRSIQGAAREMSLSYVKALRILNRLERRLGRTLLVRRKGGAAHGGTELTPFARRFARDFGGLQRTIRRAADRAFSGFRKTYERRLP